MKKKNIYPYIAAILLCMGCSKDPQIERVFFTFEMPFAITPNAVKVKVGDTLRMEAHYSDSLFDIISQKKYDLDCWPFPSFIAVRELVDPSSTFVYQKGATNAFSFFFGNSSSGVTGSTFATINLDCINGNYTFDLKFIPKRKGVFAISIMDQNAGDIQLPSSLTVSTKRILRKPVGQFNRYIFNNGVTHFEIFRQNALKANPDVTGRVIEEYCTYTFIVE